MNRELRSANVDAYGLTASFPLHLSPFTRHFSFAILLVAHLHISVQSARAEDWPTHQHDNARSAQTGESLDLPLSGRWVYSSRYRPQQAWTAAAKWDGWNKVYDLKDRMTFDKTFHVAVAGQGVYFGSSVDDKIYCLDAATGQIRWTFYTEGPVRLAPSVVNGRVYVGSDDGHVYCLAAETGSLLWRHRPGPADVRVPGNGRIVSLWAVRSSVAVVDETVYACAGVFPSETVYLCALDAKSGSEIWKTEIKDFPAQGYLLASKTRLYVTTGRSRPVVFERDSGKRLYEITGGAGGGTYALLTGDTLLFGPGKTGEISAHASNQSDYLASFSGNHMIVTPAASYLHTDTQLSSLDRTAYVKLYSRRRGLQRRKTELGKTLKKVNENNNEKNGETIDRIRRDISRLDGNIDAITKKMRQCYHWEIACNDPLSLILAGELLFAGGAGEVAAFNTDDGSRVWDAAVDGNVYGLAVANGRLLASTDAGSIHCFAATERAGDSTKRPNDQLPSTTSRPRPARQLATNDDARPNPAAGRSAAKSKSDAVVTVPGLLGPFVEFVRPDAVRVEWTTDEATTSVVEFNASGHPPGHAEETVATTEHALIVSGIDRETIYKFRVGGINESGRELVTPWYEFDSTFNYLPASLTVPASPPPGDPRQQQSAALARKMIEAAGTEKGYAIVLGGGSTDLVEALARLSDLRIIVVEEDAVVAARARETFDRAGLYGARVCVFQSRFNQLPFGPYIANLVVALASPATGGLSGRFDELYRALRPAGGVMYVGQLSQAGGEKLTRAGIESWLGTSEGADLSGGSGRFVEEDGLFWLHRRGKLPGSGEWTHQYGLPDNAACSRDDLLRGDLSVLWWGRPGPRPMPDRGPRNPAPVSANGRLYIQGNRTLFGLDAYNGTILWAKQIPTMRRANMPRDCSNMIATDDYLYVAIGDRAVGFDGQTGGRVLNLRVATAANEQARDWGYLAAAGDLLLGSSTKRESGYIGDEGEWYEGAEQGEISRVTSDSLFAVDRHTGRQKWQYHRGVILNSTITVSSGTVHFVESRNPAALQPESSRLLESVQRDQHLVAIDVNSGEILWETPYDFSKCHYMTYMSHSDDTLVVVGTDPEKVFHVYAFDSRTGYEIWQHAAKAQKTHHSGHLAHPTIVGGRLYLNKHTYELSTGNVLSLDDFDWHGCGVMSASKHSIFHRFEFHGMLDLETNRRTEFLGIRSGCWLSLIPSGGVLLAPETSSGCSCTHSIQTTLAYAPKSAFRHTQTISKSP